MDRNVAGAEVRSRGSSSLPNTHLIKQVVGVWMSAFLDHSHGTLGSVSILGPFSRRPSGHFPKCLLD